MAQCLQFIESHTKNSKDAMIAKLFSGTFHGVNAIIVNVEVDVNRGLPAVIITGLPDTAVRESRTRVESAIENSGFSFPVRRIAINLAPADIKKEGPAFDLPTAIGILQATEQCETFSNTIFVGELSLDGTIKPVKGILPIAIAAQEQHIKNLVIPYENAEEAAAIDGISIFPVKNLCEAVLLCKETSKHPYKRKISNDLDSNVSDIDFSDIKGHAVSKRAIEIAAAGYHNILMIGSPGVGKTMLAKRIPTVLPNMSVQESIETTKIYSITGKLKEKSLMKNRPFRNPHHTISDAALVGGSVNPKPGEITLAHNGVLFLDELTEFRRNVLEVLRQPLADHYVTISRARLTVNYPARFMLVASMNPCPCGYLLDSSERCTCNEFQITRYLNKISGPLLDRIDIHLEVPKLPAHQIIQMKSETQTSSQIRKNVEHAHMLQQERFKESSTLYNACMNSKEIQTFCKLGSEETSFILNIIQKMGFSARTYDKILTLSRTIADIDDSDKIMCEHIAEAVQYRSLDRSSLFGIT